MQNYKLKVITSYKLADAFICRELEKHFPKMEIIRYQVPLTNRRKWYIKKLTKEGFFSGAGIKLMGIYLGLGSVYNQLINRAVWQVIGLPLPCWNNIKAEVNNCHSETELFSLLQGADCILALDTIRLPQKFFLRNKAPFLQAVYGMAPQYTGHTGIFWAYAGKDFQNTGISIVRRGKYFNKSQVLASATIQITEQETLRSLRTKASIKIAEVLPSLISKIASGEVIQNPFYNMTKKKYCTTPTLYFYLRFRLMNMLENILSRYKLKNKKYAFFKI